MLDADREAHITFRHAGRHLLRGRELRMRGRRGMDRKAAHIADIGDVIKELQRVDEAPPGLAPARELEADEAAVAALQIFLCALARPPSASTGRSP